MRRALIASVVAVVALTTSGGAAADETGFAEKLRLQGGYTHLTQNPRSDIWVGAIPDLSWFTNDARSRLRLAYQFGYTMHTARAGEIANRLSLDTFRELSPRTLLLVTTRVSQSSVAQSFIADPAVATQFGAVPSARTQLLSGAVAEATSWEASPIVRVDQQVDGRYVTPIDAPSLFRNMLVNATSSVERVFVRDAVGVLGRVSYGYTRVPDGPDAQVMAGALAPRWRHDLGKSVTTSIAAGAAVVSSPDEDTRTVVRPFGQALLAVTHDQTSVSLTYTEGPRSNVTTAQLLDAHQAGLRGSVPLSYRHHVFLGASTGYLHGERVDLRRGAPTTTLDVVLADAALSWAPFEGIQVFARYQFFDQMPSTADVATVVRHAGIVGIQLSSRRQGIQAEAQLPQRVDRGDAQSSSESQ